MPESRVLVNLGCGSRAHGDWINIDYSLAAKVRWIPVLRSRLNPLPPGYRNWNLRNGIPLQTGTADVVYASHVLEHIDHNEAPAFCAEIVRVLKPGGIVRLVVPDLETAARNYLAALNSARSKPTSSDACDAHGLATIVLLDQMVRREPGGELATWLRAHSGSPIVFDKGGIFLEIAQSKPSLERRSQVVRFFAQLLGLLDPVKTGEVHRWMYDEVSLRDLLGGQGFREISRRNADESRIAGWDAFGLDTNRDGSPHHPDSIWIEAIK